MQTQNIGTTVVDRETEQGVLRELDTEIAERVMGESIPPSPIGCPHFLNTLSPQKAWHHVRDFDHGGGECKWEPEPFSSSIEAAMRVVEKMRTRGFRWSAQTPHGKGWEIQCYTNHSAPKGERFRGLLPEAICRAALHAMKCLSISALGTNGQAS